MACQPKSRYLYIHPSKIGTETWNWQLCGVVHRRTFYSQTRIRHLWNFRKGNDTSCDLGIGGIYIHETMADGRLGTAQLIQRKCMAMREKSDLPLNPFYKRTPLSNGRTYFIPLNLRRMLDITVLWSHLNNLFSDVDSTILTWFSFIVHTVVHKLERKVGTHSLKHRREAGQGVLASAIMASNTYKNYLIRGKNQSSIKWICIHSWLAPISSNSARSMTLFWRCSQEVIPLI